MRLLYIDDDRINTFLFEETCRLAPGLEVRCAYTGQDGLEQAADFKPDVLVIDLHLPDTDGYALLAALRALAGSGQIEQRGLDEFCLTHGFQQPATPPWER